MRPLRGIGGLVSFFFCLCFFRFPAGLAAPTAVDAIDDLARVDQALSLHLPGVAVAHASEALLSAEDPRTILELKRRLLEACVRDGQYESALKWSRDPALIHDRNRPFWRGIALLELDREEEGVSQLQTVAGDLTAPLCLRAAFTLARHYAGRGKVETAISGLRHWLSSENSEVNAQARHLAAQIALEHHLWEQAEGWLHDPFPGTLELEPPPDFLRARLAFHQGRHREAVHRFEEIAENLASNDAMIRHQARVWVGRVWVRMGEYAHARQSLAKFIDENPRSPLVAEAFGLLGEGPEMLSLAFTPRWEGWKRHPNPNVRNQALYYGALALWSAREYDTALRALTEIPPNQVLYVDAQILSAAFYLERNAPERCLERVAHLRSAIPETAPAVVHWRLDALEADAQFQSKRYDAAVALYRKLARDATADPDLAGAAWHNTALAAFLAGQSTNYFTAISSLQLLAQAGANRPRQLRGDALLAKGVALANDPEQTTEARATLNRFLEEHPDHDGVTQARIALAEIGLLTEPRDLDGVMNIVESIRRTEKITPSDREQVDYLEIRVASYRNLPDLVIQLTDAFLNNHPHGSLKPEIRLKRAEAYFAKQNFANAGSELALLAAESPRSALIANAKFLEAAAVLNIGNAGKAIELWGEVVENAEGELNLLARHQQAIALCQLGERQDALAQFDAVIAARPPTELLVRTLMAKGECLTVLGAKERSLNDEAIKVFDQIIALPGITPFWRDQAYYRKGIVHEQNNELNEAIGAFQVVLGFPLNDGKSSSHWYYRAGFEAIALLESQEKWAAAAQIASDMAKSQGPRAEEARQRAESLKTEHFLFYD